MCCNLGGAYNTTVTCHPFSGTCIKCGQDKILKCKLFLAVLISTSSLRIGKTKTDMLSLTKYVECLMNFIYPWLTVALHRGGEGSKLLPLCKLLLYFIMFRPTVAHHCRKKLATFANRASCFVILIFPVRQRGILQKGYSLKNVKHIYANWVCCK